MNKIIILVSIFFCCAQQLNSQTIYLDSLKQLLSSSNETTETVILLGKLSTKYAWTSTDSGRKYAEEGLRLAKKLDFKYGEAICSLNLSLCLFQQGSYTAALDLGYKSLAIFESLKDTIKIVLSHGILMICYREQGDYNQALVQGYMAKDFSVHSRYDSLTILSNISSVYEKSNNLDSALFYGLKAYQLNDDFKGQLITLGNIYNKLNKPRLAHEYYKKVAKNASDWAIMDAYLGVSKVFELEGIKDSAIWNAKKSFAIGESIGNPRGKLDASKQLAHLYELNKQSDSVVKYLKLTMSLNDSVFSNQNVREAQNFAFNTKLNQQELEVQQVQNRNKIKVFGLLVIILVFILIALIQQRSNKHKQQAHILLQKQKDKVDHTLQELKSTQSLLIQSEKMASLGELTAGIAHEIQNPLNFVNNFSEMNTELIEQLDEASRNEPRDASNEAEIINTIKQNLEKINHHGKRAERIVKGMLQHSRKSTGTKEPTNINALVDEYMRLSYHGLRAKDKAFNAEFKMDLDPTMPLVNVIPQDIGRVLLNLFNNAFWAVNEKNVEMVKRKSGEVYKPCVTMKTRIINKNTNSSAPLRLCEISISDNGFGISPNIIDKIFQPFFTTKPTGQGTGLGLSLAYDIVKSHGGELNVDTRDGIGSTFIIHLPIN